MVKILVSVSHTKIDFSNSDSVETKKTISLIKSKFTVHNSSLMRDPRVLRGIMKPEHCFYDEQYSLLPTGLVPHLRIYLKKESIDFEIRDIRKFPVQNKNFLDSLNVNTLIGTKKPRDYQIEAIQTLAKYRCGILEAGTGAGKSFVIAGICHLYSHSQILILFNRVSLLEQTRDVLVNEFGFTRDEIGLIGGGFAEDDKRITLMMVQSYQNIFHLFPRVRILITDEAHETGRSPTAEKVIHSCQNASVRIGFSATVETIENPYEKMKLYSNIGPILYKLPYDELRDKGVLATGQVSMYKIGTPNSIRITGSWADMYESIEIDPDLSERYIDNDWEIVRERNKTIARRLVELGDESQLYTYNEKRNRLIADIALARERVLILFGKIAHGDELKKLLPEAILISGKDSLIERNRAKAYLKDNSKSIVLASDIFSTGVDIPSVKTLIFAGSSVNTTRIIQKIGRGTRKDSLTLKDSFEIVDFLQADNPLSLKQSNKRKRVYETILKLPVQVI